MHALAVSDADNFNSGASDMHTTSGQSSSNNIPFLSPRLTPSLNFNEFALLCAHLMSADACLPVERLKSCFNETLSMAHSQWAKRVVSVYSPSFSTGLAIELGSLCMDSSLTETDTLMASMTSVLSQAKVLPFRSSWRQVWVEPDSTDSSEGTVDPGSANREQVALPTSICTSLAAFLFSFSHAAACSLLSVDTVQQLPPPDLFPTPLTLENGDDEIVESVNRIAHYASTTLFSTALSAAVDTYTTLLKQASSSSEKNLSEEDVAIQAVFDLMACESLGGRCGLQESRTLRDCMAGWKARLDPINAEIMIPLLVAASDQFAIKNHLLLPGVKQPKGVLLSVPNVSTSSSSSSSLAAINSNASAVIGLFPTTAASRFSLLPLPMSTHFQGSSWVDRDKERERGSFVAEKPEQQPAFATKTLLGGLSLNQQQQNHAEQIGKSLISTWGTFMGQTQ